MASRFLGLEPAGARTRRGWPWGALLLAAGCSGGQSGAEVDDNPPGSVGEAECSLDAECLQGVEADLDALSISRSVDYAVSGSSCEQYNVSTNTGAISGSACACELEGGGSRTIGPVGLGCYAAGRGGDCLWSDDEFSGCDLTDPNACAGVCAELETRLEADAARTFQTELIHAACEEGNCRSVVSIDGRCYANRQYGAGQDYDCALGVEAILGAHAAASQPPEQTTIPNAPTPYLPGTSAMLDLTVSRENVGTWHGPASFGAFAQFFDIDGEFEQLGEVLDPLDGVDDCGVSVTFPANTAPHITLLSVASARLRDGETEYTLEEFRSNSDSFYSYVLGLTELGVGPRHGGSYGFAASGGTFGASIELNGIVLPEALAVTELEAGSHFERGPLALSWTGRGDAPLRLSLHIEPRYHNQTGAYDIECLPADDGAFTLPADVMAGAPDGVARVTFRRERRQARDSGGKSMQTIASVNVGYELWLGPSCDGTAALAACQGYADSVSGAYTACGIEPPALETLCPDYLAQACNTCPEYFTCAAAVTRCDNGLYLDTAGCGCP